MRKISWYSRLAYQPFGRALKGVGLLRLPISPRRHSVILVGRRLKANAELL